MDRIVSQRSLHRRAIAEAAAIMGKRDTGSVATGEETCLDAPPFDELMLEENHIEFDAPVVEPMLQETGITGKSMIANDLGDDSDISDYSYSETGSDEIVFDDRGWSTTESESSDEEIENTDIHESLRTWALENDIALSSITSLLAILRPHFPNLPKDSRTLLKTKNKYEIENISGGQFHYFGIREMITKKMSFRNKLQNLLVSNLTLQVNVDGLPLFKSSSTCFWPILGMIQEEDKPEPFVIALWAGKSKPEDSNVFFAKFVEEMKDIKINGIMYAENRICLKISNFVCDTPARSFVKKTKGHTGYDSCDFCEQSGVRINFRMTFPELDAKLRTNVAFNELEYIESHQHDETILKELDLGMVSQFPHDFMHLICLGVVKKILTMLMTGRSSARRLSSNVVKCLSKTIVYLGYHLPREFTRKGRPLAELERWKATELRTFLLYIGPVALRGNVEEAIYSNFVMLFVGISILCSEKFCHNYCDYAEQLLKVWVKNFGEIYGQDQVVYNVHGVSHLAAQCRLFGPVHNFSGFPFENHLQQIKKMVRKPSQPLQQAVRRIHEKMNHPCGRKNVTTTYCKNKHNHGPIPEGYAGDQYKQLHTPKFFLSTKSPNNAVIYKNDIYLVQNIICNSGARKIVCKKFEPGSSLFDYPVDSTKLDISVLNRLDRYLHELDVDEIDGKVVLLPYKRKHVAFPML